MELCPWEVKALFQIKETKAVVRKMVLKDQTREVGKTGNLLKDSRVNSFSAKGKNN
ncbi:hypothetical protein SAMN03080598_03446 [Algoriphagus boritolerans DSM 17298 = JCM 18970]|uniref:Uncharacterized protein n=1 Tax=Algoriphagus boritolerans DSM 17298 = JCM 18970 TaxID=1120964 RepID=A0A1H5ZES2_9BACT|nr:hypothetical protein SAMN03080598_03446 [Algoriphagus boritolerans DSM 17298 = JCM 18970]